MSSGHFGVAAANGGDLLLLQLAVGGEREESGVLREEPGPSQARDGMDPAAVLYPGTYPLF